MEISVIITNYNYEKYIARSIRSVLNQSFNKNEYEILVVDDCSTDNSKNIISSFGGKIKNVYNEQNLGLAASCNKTIQSAMGKFFIRLDADDYVCRDWLLILHCFISNNKDDMDSISSDYLLVNEKETTIARKNAITWPIACGILFKTDDFIQLGGYNEQLKREDEDFRNRFLKSGKHIYNVPIPLYRYTQHELSLTKNL